MKTDQEIYEILNLPDIDDFKGKSKEACVLLNVQLMKAFKKGYKYGLLANASEKLDGCLEK